jgi:hypothetical protein
VAEILNGNGKGNCLNHSGVTELLEVIGKNLDDHNTRISTLEKFMWIVVGAISIIGVMIGSTPLVHLAKAAGL